MTRATILALAIITGTSVGAQEQTTIALREGIIIDPEVNAAYVMTVDGGVAAVDLKSGGTTWTSKVAAKPLGIVRNILLSQVELKSADAARRLEVVGLDIRAGGERKTRAVATLPPSVHVSVGESLDGTFSAMAEPFDGGAVVAWNFDPAPRREMRARPKQSFEPQEASAAPTSEDPSGVLRLDLGAERMDDMPGVPGRFVMPDKKWFLHAQRDAQSDSSGRWYESADQRHALKSERIGNNAAWEKYRWTVTERETGKTIGTIASHLSFTPFVVRDSVIVFETTPYWRRGSDPEPAKLRGVSLENGKEAWAFPVREVVSRAPMPP